MQHTETKYSAPLLVLICGIVGCGQSGERAAQHWMSEQAKVSVAPAPPPVPEIIDTPPANFTSKAIDPFSPERITSRFRMTPGGNATGVIFPDTLLSELVLVGFISGFDLPRVAIVRNRNEYRSVRKGNRISEQGLWVKEVEDQALVLGAEGFPDQRLVRGK
jgi:Tfp pilus assembly protein PilP